MITYLLKFMSTKYDPGCIKINFTLETGVIKIIFLILKVSKKKKHSKKVYHKKFSNKIGSNKDLSGNSV